MIIHHASKSQVEALMPLFAKITDIVDGQPVWTVPKWVEVMWETAKEINCDN